MVCRLCFLESPNSMEIFGLEGKELSAATIIGQHFWFEIKEDDSVSNCICSDCWQHVDNFHSFYLRVEEAQRSFSSRTSVEFISAGRIKSEAEDSSVQDVEDICNEVDEQYGNIFSPLTVLKTDEMSDVRKSILGELQGSKIKKEKTKYASIQSKNESTEESSDGSEHINLKTEKSLSEYAKKSKENDRKIAGFMKLKCVKCEVEEETFSDVKKHYETVHKIRGFVICCNKKFWKRSYLLDHINQHLNPECLKCQECDKTFTNKDYFRKHMKDHSSTRVKLFKCDECSKEFHTQTLLSRHKFTHVPTDQRQYFCDECKKPFGSFGLLRQHQRFVHENVYGKMCHICAKVIRGKKEFAKHQMEHEGIAQPKVKCQICGALFKSQTTLKSHMHSHTDNTEYVCNICGNKTRTKRNLESHIRRVHSARYSYKCTICDKTFKRKIRLTEHLTTHTGERLYNCPYCSKSYTWNGNLHAHKKKAHPKEWEECRKTRCTGNSDVAI